MKKYKYIALFIILCTFSSVAYAASVFTSNQVGISPSNGKVLQTDGTNSTWVATSTLGFGSGSGTDVNWTFFNGSGIHPATTTNQVLIGGSATTTNLGGLEVQGPIYSTIAGGTGASVSLRDRTSYAELQSFNSKPLSLNPQGNNVGIGTTGPLYKLHVNVGASIDGIRISNNGATNNPYADFDLNTSGTSYLQIAAGDNLNNRTVALNPFGGNVGIGTSTPNFTLDVNGNARVNNTLNMGEDSSGNPFGYINSTSNGINIGVNNGNNNGRIVFNGQTTEYARFDSNGNFGIGTNTPSGLLTLAYASNNGALALLASNGSPGNLFTTDGTGSLFIHNNNNNASQEIKLSRAYDNDQAVSFRYTPGTVGVPGGVLQIGQLDKNNPNFTHGVTSFYTNGIERARFNSSGNFGISSTTPGSLFSIGTTNGINFSTASTTFNSTGGINLVSGCYAINGTCIGGSGGSGTVNTGIFGQLAFYGANGTTVSGTSTIVVGTTTADANFVGIGTTNPTQQLQVSGNTLSSKYIVNDGGEYWFRGTTSGNNFMKYDSGNNQDGPAIYGNGSVGLGVGGTPNLIVKASTVGIGTTTPGFPLQVAKNSTGSVADTSGQLSLTGATTANQMLHMGYQTDSDYGWIEAVKTGITTEPFLINPRGGNVAIGMTALPTVKFQVAGASTYNVDAAQALRVSDNTTPAKGIGFGYDTTLDAGFIQAGNFGSAFKSLLLNPNLGNVGIGTTTPADLLTVNGTISSVSPASANDTRVYFTSNIGAYGSLSASNAIGTLSKNLAINEFGGNVGVGTSSPNSILSAAGGVSFPIVTKSSNYTLTGSDYAVEETGAVTTITLPTAIGIAGRMYVIKDASGGAITLNTTSSQTIFTTTAVTSVSLTAGVAYTVQSDGSNWIAE